MTKISSFKTSLKEVTVQNLFKSSYLTQGSLKPLDIGCAYSTYTHIFLAKYWFLIKQGARYWVCRNTPSILASVAPAHTFIFMIASYLLEHYVFSEKYLHYYLLIPKLISKLVPLT